MAFNPYLKIKQNQIMTASPAELTLMLYVQSGITGIRK